MSAKIIDGKEISNKLLENLKLEVEKLDKKPALAVIIVGDNPASKIYVKNKIEKSKYAGFNSLLKELPHDTTKQELINVIDNLNNDESIDAVLLQLPLPNHLNKNDFLDRISPEKDVDGFNSYNAGKLFLGQTPYAFPCTSLGIIKLLKLSNVEIKGKISVVAGRSNIVGKPVSQLLLRENSTVICAHSKTKNLKDLTLMADILVSATGVEGLIKGDMIKEGAVVIDVGITKNKEGKLRGDVVFEEVCKKASFITPVPGGVGPMTIYCLLENTLSLYKMRRK